MDLLHVLCALTTILICTRIFGFLARRIGQPEVIGEVFGGIVLGPSLFGILFPQTSAWLFPVSIHPSLFLIAQLGIIFYMFVVGMEFDPSALKSKVRSTVLISHTSIALPFVFGFCLGHFAYSTLAEPGANSFHFSLFMGISLSITAFPVLARILREQKLEKTTIGRVSLACASIDDVTAWCLLALCLSLMQAKLAMGLLTLALTVVYIVGLVCFVRPRLVRWVSQLDERKEIGMNVLSVFFVALFLSAFATELIGIHAIFGAFLLGVIIPPHSRIKEELTQHTENLSRIVFLPVFFVFTGLRTQIGLLNSAQDWALCLGITLLAILGKFGGATLAARYSGHNWRESSAIGALMNTRGLVELVVLNIGLDVGILNPRMFTMLVLMAIITTFMTTPLLNWILTEDLADSRQELRVVDASGRNG